jgi:hypothetical protein
LSKELASLLKKIRNFVKTPKSISIAAFKKALAASLLCEKR